MSAQSNDYADDTDIQVGWVKRSEPINTLIKNMSKEGEPEGVEKWRKDE